MVPQSADVVASASQHELRHSAPAEKNFYQYFLIWEINSPQVSGAMPHKESTAPSSTRASIKNRCHSQREVVQGVCIAETIAPTNNTAPTSQSMSPIIALITEPSSFSFMTFLFAQPAVAQMRVVNITLCFMSNSRVVHKTQGDIFSSQNPQYLLQI